MLDLFPAEVGNVDETVHAVLEFDEGPEVGQVSHRSLHFGTDRIFPFDVIPWVGLYLFHSQGDSLSLLI